VIAFPQNAAGVSLVDDCPNEIDPRQWQELHIRPAEGVVPRNVSK